MRALFVLLVLITACDTVNLTQPNPVKPEKPIACYRQGNEWVLEMPSGMMILSDSTCTPRPPIIH